MVNKRPEPFEGLSLPRKDLALDLNRRYRLYRESGEIIAVDATTALEALQASGLTDVKRIERDSIDANNVLEGEVWKKDEQSVKNAESTVVSVDAAVQTAPEGALQELPGTEKPSPIPEVALQELPAAEQPPQEPLSGDEVNKLLNG